MKKIIIFIIFINLLLGAGQLILANLRAGDGDQIAKLESQARTLTLQNDQLESSIYSASSLSSINAKAQAANYRPIATMQLAPADLAAVTEVSRP